MLGSKFARQQREPFLFVSAQCRSSVAARRFDGANGIGHAGVALRLPCCRFGCPSGESLAGTGRFTTPLIAHPRSLSLCLLLRRLLLGAGLASAEPADSGEAGTCGGFVLDGGKVGRTVALRLLDEWPGDLGTDSLGGIFGCVDRGGALLIFGAGGGALGVETCGDPLPPLRCSSCVCGFLVEAGEFFSDELDRAISNETAHGLDGLLVGVFEAPVCGVAFDRLNELCSRLRHVLSDDVQPVRPATSRHPHVYPCRARRVGEHSVGGGDGCALDTVCGCRVGQVRMLCHIVERKGDGAGVLAAVADLTGVESAVVGDLLHDPLLPVRDPECGVVLPGLDQVTGTDGQAVAAGLRHRVINLAPFDAPGADAGMLSLWLTRFLTPPGRRGVS